MASREVKQEIDTIGSIHDLMQSAQFPGHLSEKVLIGVLYLRKLHGELVKKTRADEEALAEQMAPTPKQVEEAKAIANEAKPA